MNDNNAELYARLYKARPPDPGLTEEEEEDEPQAMVDAEDTVGANEITETPNW
jgi:hypothetical protein